MQRTWDKDRETDNVLSIEEELEYYKAINAELLAEGRKLVEWLDRLAARADENAKDRRFISLAEANLVDARNYRATAKGMRSIIAKAEGKA